MQEAYQRLAACRRHSIMGHYENAWQAVRERIDRAAAAAGRDPGSVRLLAVSKTFPPGRDAGRVRTRPARVRRELRAGGAGEDGRARRPADLEWHLIGPLQGNKTRSRRRALRLGGHGRPARDRGAPFATRVRRSCRRSTSACRSTSAARRPRAASRPRRRCALAHAVAALPRLALRGLMGIAEPTAGRRARAAEFAVLRRSSTPAAPAASRSTRCRWACRPIWRRRLPKARPRCASAARSSVARTRGVTVRAGANSAGTRPVATSHRDRQ